MPCKALGKALALVVLDLHEYPVCGLVYGYEQIASPWAAARPVPRFIPVICLTST
jgi:hypothetical protein